IDIPMSGVLALKSMKRMLFTSIRGVWTSKHLAGRGVWFIASNPFHGLYTGSHRIPRRGLA
nr:hypothetical protein [Actinomycetes bacterium]